MRDRHYLILFLLVSGLLLFLGRDLIQRSVVVAWTLMLVGTSAVAVLSVALYRIRLALHASRRALALQEAELSFALKVQQALFPRQLPTAGGLDFAAVCLPARGISGDFYDVLQLPDGRILFAVADISGKGIPAAILMASVHSLLRTVATMAESPREVCRRLNYHMHQVTEASRFATLFYAEWNPEGARLRYVNAGHNPPFLLGRRQTLSLNHGGLPLGVLPDSEFEVGELVLEPGELLVLFSDGITEAGAFQQREYGLERLQDLVLRHRDFPLAEIQARVLQSVRDWAGPEPEDDVTLVLVRCLGGRGQGGLETGRSLET